MPKVLTFDSEANGLLPTVTHAWCITTRDHETQEKRSYGPDSILAALTYLSTADVLIGHGSIDYDFPMLRKCYNWEFRGIKVDTLLMSRLQRPERKAPPNCPNKRAPHSVEAWGYRLGHRKVEHEEWDKYSPEMLHRCEEDRDIQYEIFLALIEEGKGEGWRSAHMMNHKLFDLLQRQEEHGWYIDLPYMDACIHQLDRWIVRITNAVLPRLPMLVEPGEGKELGEYKWVKKPFKKDGTYSTTVFNYFGDRDCIMVGGPYSRVSFRPVDLNSNAETKEYLLSCGWEPLEWNTKTVEGKEVRTSPKLSKDDPMEGIQGSLGRLIAKRVKCRHRKGTLEGLRAAVDANSVIHPAISGIASTGRMKHQLVVNIPSVDAKAFYAKPMRSCFRARPGMVEIGADSKGNQVRQLAARMGDPVFTEAVLHGTKEEDNDHHSLTRKASGVATRTLAKNVFYGTVFGAQDAKIGKIVGGTKADGARVREALFKNLPKLAELLERLRLEWFATAKKYYNEKWHKWEARDGYITGLDGRPILVDSEHKLLNYALQSDEAIQLAYGYILIHDTMEARGYVLHKDWSMLIWYHDEYQAESLPEIADELGQVMCDAIRDAGLFFNIACPHGGDYKIGNNWADCH